MARPLRIEFPGAIYHITSRGNARLPVFKDDHGDFQGAALSIQAIIGKTIATGESENQGREERGNSESLF